MQLCYRGVFYSPSNSTIDTVETTSTATFLGQSYNLRRPIHQPQTKNITLIYRGAAYSAAQPMAMPTPLKSSSHIAKLTAKFSL